MANYCFFQYLQDFVGENTPSEVEVASLNCLSIETVKKVEREALSKLRNFEDFQNLRSDLEGESAFESTDSGTDYEIHR